MFDPLNQNMVFNSALATSSSSDSLQACRNNDVDIDTVANVDDEDCIGNSLLQIWELRIVHKAKLLFRL